LSLNVYVTEFQIKYSCG